MQAGATRTDLPLAAVDIISSFMDRLTTPDREEGREERKDADAARGI
jgi:hypothetical protein